MNWVKTSERLPEANNDYYVVSVTNNINNRTYLAVALYMKHDDQWFHVHKGEMGDEVNGIVNAWVENIGPY